MINLCPNCGSASGSSEDIGVNMNKLCAACAKAEIARLREENTKLSDFYDRPGDDVCDSIYEQGKADGRREALEEAPHSVQFVVFDDRLQFTMNGQGPLPCDLQKVADRLNGHRPLNVPDILPADPEYDAPSVGTGWPQEPSKPVCERCGGRREVKNNKVDSRPLWVPCPDCAGGKESDK